MNEFGRKPGLQLFIKTPVVGGFVFLMPAVIVVVALGKLVGALKVLAQALTPTFRIESFAGGVVLDLFALAVTVLLCFVVGLLARQASAKRMRLDRTLLNSFLDAPSSKGLLTTCATRKNSPEASSQLWFSLTTMFKVAFETHRGRMTRSLFICPEPRILVRYGCLRLYGESEASPNYITAALRLLRSYMPQTYPALPHQHLREECVRYNACVPRQPA
jgi:hypothetical protein